MFVVAALDLVLVNHVFLGEFVYFFQEYFAVYLNYLIILCHIIYLVVFVLVQAIY